MNNFHRAALALLFTLIGSAPIAAQQGSLTLGNGTPPETLGEGLHHQLAAMALHFRGSGTVNAHLRVTAYHDGRVADSHTSSPVRLSSGGSESLAGLLPSEGWFDRFAVGSGDRGILSWLADLFTGGGQTATPGPWDGWTEADCNTLKGEARRNCLNAVRGRSGGGSGTIIVAVPYATDGSGTEVSGVESEGMVFIASGS